MIAAIVLIASVGAAQIPSAPVQLSGPGGLSTAKLNTLYLRLDGTNWTSITGTLWTLSVLDADVVPARRLYFTNSSGTIPSAIRVRTTATTQSGSDSFAGLEAFNAVTAGTGYSLLRLSNPSYSARFDAYSFVGNATDTAVCNNTEVCAPSDVLLASVGASQYTIGSLGSDSPVVLYGGNVGIQNREMVRLSANRVELFHHNGNASALQIDQQAGCTGCGTALASAEYYDSVALRLQLSNGNDAFGSVARDASEYNHSLANFTTASAVASTVVTTTLPIGIYHCEWTPAASNSTAAEGAAFAATAGTATIGVHAGQMSAYNSATLATFANVHGASGLADSVSTSTCANTGTLCGAVIALDLNVTAAGTVLWQASEVSHTTGTLTVFAPQAVQCVRMGN